MGFNSKVLQAGSPFLTNRLPLQTKYCAIVDKTTSIDSFVFFFVGIRSEGSPIVRKDVENREKRRMPD